jgi:hypothetical protein
MTKRQRIPKGNQESREYQRAIKNAENSKGQSRMNNPEKPATLGTQDT